jgi:SSS family solute:Na+ symporter
LLAYTTYDPASSDNFFLILANQTSYLKPGLVVVFFWGILWRRTHAFAAVVVLIGSPLIGFVCDLVYVHFLVKYTWVSATFGESFNFLYRVFMIFILGSGLIYVLSNYFNKRSGEIKVHGLSVSFSGIGNALVKFTGLQLPLLILVLLEYISPQTAAYPAAFLTFCLFLWYMKKEKESIPFYQSDIFYAGLLTATMVWIMYYFA